MNKLKPLYLSLISTVLLIIAWPPLPTAFLLFIGWIPLFVIREQLDNQPKKHLKFWAWVYLTLFLFNTGATWWVWNASPGGTVAMLISNSLLMSLPFLFYS
ncbi:MAG: apolipoprotein N-acyltransferase, partial [Bacteroidetes bacterium]|nr:apolipoprotein N-acyltransferase [Bacteroidota bacterium]